MSRTMVAAVDYSMLAPKNEQSVSEEDGEISEQSEPVKPLPPTKRWALNKIERMNFKIKTEENIVDHRGII